MAARRRTSVASRVFRVLAAAVIVTAVLSAALQPAAYAATTAADDFSLQVTPSPLITTMKPGQTTELELQIRNSGKAAEDLKMAPRAFKTDSATGAVKLTDDAPPEVKDWIGFSAPNFTVQPGQAYTQKVRIALPKDAGFSYSFALLISRQKETASVVAGQVIKGSVAVFTLVSVDKPGATRRLDIAQFASSRHIYEYLPAKLDIKLKNVGNSIVQPYGNVFIQRGSSSTNPISTLLLNNQQGYIVPGMVRVLDLRWDTGFPHYVSSIKPDGTESKKLVWKLSDISNFRIGRYTAKLVAVYNDGTRDVPVQSEISFWVIPWKLLLGALAILLLVLLGLWFIVARLVIATRRKPKD
jgi:hypothetical protein